uniref:Uncharacterized protein n=1 Tax=Kwoniella dejecticola CBS 10117 TaxID=1296121 RepID=A0A1A5ZYG5_9TREE|nr:uncharacterized protein I303_06395 [Kwoniella dejecticola CBS 10117]OBR82838.1 hypothetical protein I303_06395 [Kwoniella dejecticola CBS 10117]
MSSKMAINLLKPLLPYIPLLPTPVLSLFPSLILHIASHPRPSSTNFISASTTHPLHAPLIFTLISIPIIYILGLVSGNVSWVDRLWPFYTPFCTGFLVLWLFLNDEGGVYGHNLPRVLLMFGLQILWSIRLLSHALKRDFYNLKSEDYRYTAFRRIVPKPIFALVHIFVIAIAQPILLFSLSLPVYAIMSLPPSELAITSSYADLVVACLAIGCLVMEYRTDKAMYEFQNTKHSLMASLPPNQLVQPGAATSAGEGGAKNEVNKKRLPRPSAYPPSHHPGFPTRGMFRWSRHANFASEQIFWMTQALFVIAGSESSGVTRRSWGDGCVWAPCFAVSPHPHFCLLILFCASTFLTEWITSRKFPAYKSYKRVVGQFLPQETLWLWVIGTVMGTRQRHIEKVYGPVKVASNGKTVESKKSR